MVSSCSAWRLASIWRVSVACARSSATQAGGTPRVRPAGAGVVVRVAILASSGLVREGPYSHSLEPSRKNLTESTSPGQGLRAGPGLRAAAEPPHPDTECEQESSRSHH